MPNNIIISFDFGFKRIGVAVGNRLTCSAQPLKTLKADDGVPSWSLIDDLIKTWQPGGFCVGIPHHIDGRAQEVTFAAKSFAGKLEKKFDLPVYRVDERLTTVEARQELFENGGYKNVVKSEVDSFAAKIIAEQWLRDNKT